MSQSLEKFIIEKFISIVYLENETISQEDNEGACEGDDAGLMKRLNKQRQKAIAAARGGRRAIASRNSYKDKGSKSSHNAKIQKQLNQW